MNRRAFLGLLGLTGCKDINEDCMNISKKQWWLASQDGTFTQNPIGVIYTNSNFTDLTNWTNRETGTNASVSGGKMNFSGGPFAIYTKIITRDYYSNLFRWKNTMRFTVGSKDANSLGVGLNFTGLQSGSPRKFSTRFIMSTGTGTGKVNFSTYDVVGGWITPVTSTNALTYSVNDEIEIINERINDVLNVTCTNITTAAAPITLTYTFSYTDPPQALSPGTGCFGITQFGGTFSVTYFQIESNESTGAIVLIGDSKTAGCYAGSYAATFANLLQTEIKYYANTGGPSDRIADYAKRIDEFTLLAPSKFLVCGCSNDIRASSVTVNSDYDAFVASIAGIAPVYHLTGIPETMSQATFRTHVISTYAANRVIDSLTQTIATTDNIHPNATGHTQLADYIKSTGLL